MQKLYVADKLLIINFTATVISFTIIKFVEKYKTE